MSRDIRYQILLNETPDLRATADAEEIEVVESMHEPSTFRVRFSVDIDDGQWRLIDDDKLLPGRNIPLTVLAVVDQSTEVLVHGFITDREVDLKHGGAGSFLEIRGSDRRVAMARQCHRYKAHSGTVSSIVEGVLRDSKFAHTDVDSVKGDKYSIDAQTLNQTGSDLELVNLLAGQMGVAFWVDWTYQRGRIKETAHFASQPPRNDGLSLGGLSVPPIVQSLLGVGGGAALTFNTGDPNNTILSFRSLQRTEVPRSGGKVVRVDFDRPGLKKTTVAGPTQPLLGVPLDDPGDLVSSVLTAGGIDRAQVHTTAALNDAGWSVEASAETTVFALGQVVRPRQVVKVEGAGAIDRGDYLVWKVAHHINPATHRLALELRRNAKGA